MKWGMYSKQGSYLNDSGELDALLLRNIDINWRFVKNVDDFVFIGYQWVADRYVMYTIKKIVD